MHGYTWVKIFVESDDEPSLSYSTENGISSVYTNATQTAVIHSEDPDALRRLAGVIIAAAKEIESKHWDYGGAPDRDELQAILTAKCRENGHPEAALRAQIRSDGVPLGITCGYCGESWEVLSQSE